jgi:hypothetical protein
MANWKDFTSVTYTGADAKAALKVVLQYDKDRLDTGRVVCRTKSWCTTNHRTYDTYFLYSDDGDIARICYLGYTNTGESGNRGSNPYYSNEFTILKYDSTKFFSFPKMAICNDGAHHDPPSAYTDNNGRGYYVYFVSGRTGHKTIITTGTEVLETNQYITGVGKGSTDIVDNQDNTFTITATKGDDGNCNTASGPIDCKWGYTDKYEQGGFTSGQPIDLDISGTYNKRTVYATSTTTSYNGWGADQPAPKSAEITQYFAPKQPTKPTLTAASFKNNRLTVKQDWTYTWSCEPKNVTTSPVVGYDIRIFKTTYNADGDIATQGTIRPKNSSGNYLTGSYTWDGVSITKQTSASITFNPVQSGFKPGDAIQIVVKAYSKNGKGGEMYSLQRASDQTVVENTGIVRVRVPNNGSPKWVEGQVYVKVPIYSSNGTVTSKWVEAESIHVKHPHGGGEGVSKWVEAQ